MVAFRPETELRVKPVVRPLFFTAWFNRGAHCRAGNCADLKDGAVGVYHSGNDPRDGAIDIAAATRLQVFLDRVNFSSTPNKTGHCVIHELSVL